MWYKWLYKTQKKSQNLKTVAFCCHDLGPLVLWGWRVTANQSKVVLGDYFCPVTKYFWSDESSLFWDYKVVGNRGTRLIRIKVTRFQPRWTSVEHFELARFTNLKNILWGMLFYLLRFVESIQSMWKVIQYNGACPSHFRKKQVTPQK